jgi:transposase
MERGLWRRQRAALGEFYDVADAADIPEAARLASTIRRWETKVLAYRSDGLSNARTEAVIIWSAGDGVVDVADEAA